MRDLYISVRGGLDLRFCFIFFNNNFCFIFVNITPLYEREIKIQSVDSASLFPELPLLAWALRLIGEASGWWGSGGTGAQLRPCVCSYRRCKSDKYECIIGRYTYQKKISASIIWQYMRVRRLVVQFFFFQYIEYGVCECSNVVFGSDAISVWMCKHTKMGLKLRSWSAEIRAMCIAKYNSWHWLWEISELFGGCNSKRFTSAGAGGRKL